MTAIADPGASKRGYIPTEGHYSGRHRVPNIRQFIESLDQEKKQRGKGIDEQNKLVAQQASLGGPDTRDHVDQETADGGMPLRRKKPGTREVRDPVTGHGVEI